MVYIVSTILRKALEIKDFNTRKFESLDDVWKLLMLGPYDYSQSAIANKVTRALMNKIDFQHGGVEYDKNYPDGIPTSILI